MPAAFVVVQFIYTATAGGISEAGREAVGNIQMFLPITFKGMVYWFKATKELALLA